MALKSDISFILFCYEHFSHGILCFMKEICTAKETHWLLISLVTSLTSMLSWTLAEMYCVFLSLHSYFCLNLLVLFIVETCV